MLISLKRIKVIFEKQKRELFRNKQQFIIIVIFPLMALLYTLIDQQAELVVLFALMSTIMVPITCISSTISEENEKGTLRALIYAGTRSYEYFIGVGTCIGLLTFISVCIIGMISGSGDNDGMILAMAIISIVCSLIFGGIIGLLTKRQVNISAISAPSSLILGMLPSIGIKHSEIHRFSKYIYSQTVLDIMLENKVTTENVGILFGNVACLFVIFIFIYRKSNYVE